MQKNEEKIAADSVVEPKTSDSVQKDDLNQQDVDQLLTFNQSESPKKPAEASEEVKRPAETENLPDTDNITAGDRNIEI